MSSWNRKVGHLGMIGATLLTLLFLGACGSEPGPISSSPDEPEWPQLSGYAPMEIPADNPLAVAKVSLGKQLYYDQRLSGDGDRSCYGCHLAEHGLTDGKPVAVGAFDKVLTRSSPTMWNVGYYPEFYWDGRSSALEKQVVGAWSGGNMGASGKDGVPGMAEICERLNEIAGYREQFETVFGAPANVDNVAKAVASFMRTIVASESRWMRFRGGDEQAFSEQEKRGYEIFSEVAKCTNCHDGLLLTDLQYHNVGIGMDAESPDLGRAAVSGEETDNGAFKTPTLLDISKSAPYFHDGSVATLEEAVDLMLDGGSPNPWLDITNLQETKEAELAAEQRDDLLAFMRALDVEYTVPPPQLP